MNKVVSIKIWQLCLILVICLGFFAQIKLDESKFHQAKTDIPFAITWEQSNIRHLKNAISIALRENPGQPINNQLVGKYFLDSFTNEDGKTLLPSSLSEDGYEVVAKADSNKVEITQKYVSYEICRYFSSSLSLINEFGESKFEEDFSNVNSSISCAKDKPNTLIWMATLDMLQSDVRLASK